MKILDNAGAEVTLDELNERAAAWHAAREDRDAYWSAFYAKRSAVIEASRKRRPQKFRGHTQMWSA